MASWLNDANRGTARPQPTSLESSTAGLARIVFPDIAFEQLGTNPVALLLDNPLAKVTLSSVALGKSIEVEECTPWLVNHGDFVETLIRLPLSELQWLQYADDLVAQIAIRD